MNSLNKSIRHEKMKNTCENCKWSYIAWAQAYPDSFPTRHLRCWPGGDRSRREQLAEIPCLKWRLDDGGELEPE